MSSRLKERGGAGAKIMANNNNKQPLLTAVKRTPVMSTAGKENPRSISRGKAPPPPTKEIPRSLSRGRASAPPPPTKEIPRSLSRGRASAPPPATAAVPASVRWSTSSMPVKGKPSSKLLSDLRGDSIARSSRPDRSLERKSQQGKGRVDSSSKTRDEKLPVDGSKDLDKNGGKAAIFSMRMENSNGKSATRRGSGSVVFSNGGVEKITNSITSLEISKEKGPVLDTFSSGGAVQHGASALVNQKGNDCLVSQQEGCKISRSTVLMLDGNSLSHVGVGKIAPDRIQVFENVGEQKSDDNGQGDQVISKYPSKLHEKLALLESKVQKIASEIKQTKEMLDQNNPSESKLILTDIQNKISGIEKAVGSATDGSTLENGPSESVKVAPRVSTKGLNYQELEARFFPHHRLIRSQTTSLGSLGGQDESCELIIPKHHGDSDVKDVSLSPIDENPVALEFLASLNGEPKVERPYGGVQTGHAAVREVVERISSSQCIANKASGGNHKAEIALIANEKLDEFDDQENKPAMEVYEMNEESSVGQLFEIARKTSTGGWFVSEGEAVLLAHDDGACSYYDIANLEVKAEYKPPTRVPNNLWGDCWLIRAPGADGCSGRYVVAASAGNSQDSGFCSWDFYTRDVKAFQVEAEAPSYISTSFCRSALAPISDSDLYKRTAACTIQGGEASQWWYRPCGPLLISTASQQKTVRAYDIRDGDLIMKWEVNSSVIGMEYTSPLQWRNKGKLIVAETEAISLWDVNCLNPQPLLSIPSGGKVYSLHVNNTDAEVGGGVRQRVSSSEVDGNDGVFCTQESINVFDFRIPSGVGLKISRTGTNGHTIFSRGDNIYVGCTGGRLLNRGGSPRSQVQHFSLRKGNLATSFTLPDLQSNIHQSKLTQVWGNSNAVMGVCGMGLFVFDVLRNDGFQSTSMNQSTVDVKEVIGPDDLYFPTFDYLGSRVLVISRDRPALWRYLS